MVNGTVRDHLSTKSETPLLWNMRPKVAQDAARGLTYLHEEMDFQRFQSSNSLLDNDWNAKLLDFGVARLGLQEGFTHISTKVLNSQVNPYMLPTLAPRLWPFLSVIQPFAHWRKLPRERSVIQVNVSTPFFSICPHRWKKMMNQWLFKDEQQ
ncbi:putative non-specific serine/threonine protein kinase [Helianthus annuus]|uniref:Non-specific serine/threonine protein kinase n=1 Tax=Helianthus annuus TaxID=4232 RepID=A0A9K3NRM3_HELAN|nr:putative non-specific serine/threonine protein kinase [Helianthus annuus]KAJ0589322.1 putative non-specific serine/threonine protein kinase [Helianthus annuus]KAJ0927268.1 putative non-specific serine/threonine protein kinase [Helianthus annuus]KAJ0931694.1 putative non-specific serine/threonine protein kinase [Helianthus annuus]